MIPVETFDVTQDLRKDRIREMLVEAMQACTYCAGADPEKLQFHHDDDLITVPSENVKVTRKRNRDQDIAHCYYKAEPPRIILGLYPKNWNTLSPVERFVTIGHELTHLRYTGHQRRYWKEMMRNVVRMIDRRDQLVAVFAPDHKIQVPHQSLPVYNVVRELHADIQRNCEAQTEFSHNDIAELQEMAQDRVAEYFDRNPSIRAEWMRQKKRYADYSS